MVPVGHPNWPSIATSIRNLVNTNRLHRHCRIGRITLKEAK